MSTTVPDDILQPFLTAAGEVARRRDDVDLGTVVAALSADLVAPDPGAAVRARAEAVRDDDPRLHDPAGVRAAYLVSVAVLQL